MNDLFLDIVFNLAVTALVIIALIGLALLGTAGFMAAMAVLT